MGGVGIPDSGSANESLIQGYQDWTEIGRGGFGVVYRAREARFRRDVAIKVLSGTLSEDARARFLRECEAVGSLSGHPGIVAVHDMGFTDDGRTTYLVMEDLPGGTLLARAAGSGLPWREAVECVVALAGALESAHRAGVLHRDVKPENVLFTAFGAAKIVDFGIATVGGGYQTRSAAITASLAHAAPEIVAGERATAASDTYSLASTLFYALTGSAPFASQDDETLIPLIARISTQPLPDLRKHGVPPEVAAAVERAMAKDPAGRTPGPLALAEELVAAAGRSGVTVAEPVLVAPPTHGDGGQQAPHGETQVVGRRREPQDETGQEQPGGRGRGGRRVWLAAAAAMLGLLSVGGIGYAAVVAGAQQPTATAVEPVVSSPGPASQDETDPLTAEDSIVPDGPTTPATEAPAPGGQVSLPDSGSKASSQGVAPNSQPPTNRPPTIPVPGDQTSQELSAQNLALTASDSDGDPVSFTVTGLPAGLSSTSSGVISGTIRPDAASVTEDRRTIGSRAFIVTVRASDGTDTTTLRFTWTVADTHTTMPDYFGKYGCDGDAGCAESVPNVAVISSPTFACTTVGTGTRSTIAKQSVAPGSVIRWGQSVMYTYLETMCA